MSTESGHRRRKSEILGLINMFLLGRNSYAQLHSISSTSLDYISIVRVEQVRAVCSTQLFRSFQRYPRKLKRSNRVIGQYSTLA